MSRVIHSLLSFAVCCGAFYSVGQLAAQSPEVADRSVARESSSGPRPDELPPELGAAEIPDRTVFQRMSYQGSMRMDSYLSDLQFVKFIVTNVPRDDAQVYWMNTQQFQAHPHFMRQIGLPGGPGGRGRGRGGPPRQDARGGGDAARGTTLRGAVTFFPRQTAPNDTAGLYVFDFQPNDYLTPEQVEFTYKALTRTAPFLKGKLAFHPFRASDVADELDVYAKANVPVRFDDEIYDGAGSHIGFLPLNHAESFGVLRFMDNETRPAPRDIVICKTLPNQMPRVAGVISEVRQTPLSHVNLRAIQDKVPNAFIVNASKSPDIQPLIGKLVRYHVTVDGYALREATQEEVDKHFQQLRPSAPQQPPRDISVRAIRKLADIGFQHAASFGRKTSNLAAMQDFELPAGVVPDGLGIPFYYYDEFMRHNGLYKVVAEAIRSESFQQDREVRRHQLKRIRKAIKAGDMPDWMMASLGQAQSQFPPETSIRCRSSSNCEDGEGFSGAGLYDSYTHHPQEGHLAKSIKQVYASLWNFRAFEEREFYRIPHRLAAMGVLLHPNFKKEQINGVAVTDDILYDTQGNYYLNSLRGEDLVTNPSESANPEEVLLGWYEEDGDRVVRAAGRGERILSDGQLNELRPCLARIHARFRDLYQRSDETAFAMEVEFKITQKGKLVIKQARPWVF